MPDQSLIPEPVERLDATAPRSQGARRASMLLAGALIVVLCVSLVALDTRHTREGRELRLVQSETVLTNFTRSLAQHAEDKIKEADTYLTQLVERLQVHGMGEAHATRLQALLMGAVSEMPQLHGLFVYDETGRWVANSQPVLLTQFNNSDRNYFLHHRDNPDERVYVGPPIRSRSTGDWIITVSRRVDKLDGNFGGVVLATMAMSHFNDYYSGYDIGDAGTITLLQSNGTLLARHPFAEDAMGTLLGDDPLYRDQVLVRSRGVVRVTLADGQQHMAAFRHIDRYPLAVVVTQSRDEVLADWSREARTRSLGVLLLSIVLAVLGLFALRMVAQRLRAEDELRGARDALHAANLRLQRLAAEDGLTGLGNRRAFDERLAAELSRTRREHVALSLLLIDVDHFKPYNDLYGHLAGDDCLRAVSAAIRQIATHRGADFAARYGGEEFAVLLPNTPAAGARLVAERLRAAIAELQLVHEGSPGGRLTVSLGVAELLPGDNITTAETLIQCADQALYAAKESGRDRVVTYPAEPGL